MGARRKNGRGGRQIVVRVHAPERFDQIAVNIQICVVVSAEIENHVRKRGEVNDPVKIAVCRLGESLEPIPCGGKKAPFAYGLVAVPVPFEATTSPLYVPGVHHSIFVPEPPTVSFSAPTPFQTGSPFINVFVTSDTGP